jgi:hypothetical protein
VNESNDITTFHCIEFQSQRIGPSDLSCILVGFPRPDGRSDRLPPLRGCRGAMICHDRFLQPRSGDID